MLRLTFALCVFSAVLSAEGEPTHDALGKQFDAQVARLVERGYPAMFGERAIFDKEMARLREETVRYKPAKPDYTFLIVIPFTDAPLPWQVKRIIMPTGEVTELSEPHLTRRENVEIRNRDDVAAPGIPYLIYDVDEGDDTAKRWVCDAVAELRDAGRRPLTLEECVSLLVQRPEILGTRKVAAAGTAILDRNHQNPVEQLAYWRLDPAHPHNPWVNLAPWTAFNVPTNAPFGAWRLTDYQFPSCAGAAAGKEKKR